MRIVQKVQKTYYTQKHRENDIEISSKSKRNKKKKREK